MLRTDRRLLAAFLLLAGANLTLFEAGTARVAVAHLLLTAAPALAAGACLRAARRGARRSAPSWRLIGAGAMAVAAGQAVWFAEQMVLQRAMTFPSLSFYLFLAFHPLFAIGVLRSLRRRRDSDAPIELALDGLIATAAIAAILVRYLHEPLRMAQPWLTYQEVSWIVGGQFLSQLSLVAVGVLVIWRRSLLSPRAVIGIGVVAVINAVGNTLQMASLDPNPGAPGDGFDLLWLTGWGFLAWAGASGAMAGEQAWSGPVATWVSGRLRQSVAPVAGVVMTVLTIDIAARGGAGPELIAALCILGLLLSLRTARAVGAIERENRERRELARTRTLVQLSRAFAAAPRLDDALQHVLVAAESLVSAHHVWIEREDTNGVIHVHSRTAAVQVPPTPTAAWLEGRRFGQRLAADAATLTGDDSRDGRMWTAAARIRFGEHGAGTLFAARDDAGFSADDLQLLGGLADQAALAIANATLLDDARRAERERVSNEKLASLGNIVAGVAHEINNPLTAIQSAAALLSTDLPEGCNPDTLDIMQAEAARAAGIVRRMLDFVRPASTAPGPLDIGSVLADVLRARADHHAHGGIHVDIAVGELPPVIGESSRLHQVFLNLIVNAEHAMAANERPRRLAIKAESDPAGVTIRICDNGSGIPDHLLPRIFDPYFTTKAPGSGTGLGLPLSHGIVRELGGSLHVSTVVGAGTTFSVQLPIATAPAVVPGPAPRVETAPGRPTLSILLVEDETSIRTLVARYLRRRGDVVDTAANGRDALDILARRRYDVIVTDMRMPDIGGEDLYARLLDANPDQARRVLFISGDTVADGTREFLLGSGRLFLSKPFDLDDLAGRIDEAAAAADAEAANARLRLTPPQHQATRWAGGEIALRAV